MNTIMAVIFAFILYLLVLLVIVAIPIGFGMLFLRWSKKRAAFIFSETASEVATGVIGTLVLSGLILLIGSLFKAKWAFSGGLLFVYTFWLAIKSVAKNIKGSRGM